jgi:cytochrome c553
MNHGTLRKWSLRALVALPLALALALAVVSSGIVPVEASSGHWPITNWFLHYAMRRSIATHARSVDVPALDASWLVLKGAGHFETGCRPCHGAPDLAPPVIPRAMTPHPPALTDAIAGWSPAELFYVVKHGVKFTAMPAWPAQERDDEVFAMVAFLRKLPALDADAYRALVHGEVASRAAAPDSELVPTDAVARRLAASCARCHGARGEGRGSAAFPKLAGQKLDYQIAALKAYARGARRSGMMEPVAAGLTDDELHALSRYYAAMADPRHEAADGAARTRGAQIAEAGVPARGVPPCVECHGPTAEKRSPHYPLLAGQYADYLVLQLRLFKDRTRGGSPYAHLMEHVAARLDDTQMRDVAAYYASLPASAP